MTPRIWLYGFLITIAFGCDRAPRETPPVVETPVEIADDPNTKLAIPDLARMSYDPAARVLQLYDLESGQKWMLAVPWNKRSEPVESYHAFMTDVDLEKVAVFYTTPSGRVSQRVTLREIVTQAITHTRR